MRRMVFVGFCLLGLGLLIWLLRARPGRLREGKPADSLGPATTASSIPRQRTRDAANRIVVDLSETARTALADESGADGVEAQDELLIELSRIRC